MTELLPGAEIQMGGKGWIVPPLTLGQLRRLAPQIGALSAGDRLLLDPATLDAVVTVVTAALRRNYPDLDEAAVAEMLDMGNAAEVFVAVLTGSGLKRAGPGEASAAAGDGTNSTASSPPPSAGASATSTS